MSAAITVTLPCTFGTAASSQCTDFHRDRSIETMTH